MIEESKSGDSSLHDWFTKSKSSDGKPGWVQLGGKYAGKPCAKQPGQTTKPKCGSSKMKRALSKDEEDAAFRRKNRQDPNPDRKGKAINVKTEENQILTVMNAARKLKEEEGKKDACYHKVKSRYKVWPSAYASGALVKCRKKGASNWGNKSEEVSEAIRYPAVYGNIISIILTWRGKSYMTKMFFPNAKLPTRSDVKDQIEKVYPGATILTYQISNIQPGEPLIHVTEGAAWTRKAGQNKEGGLNEKGRKSYERENPGSDLKAPSKKVGNPRRASFCARMKGMKKKLTSAKTASDPNSRINKSLRAWNC